MFKELFCYNPCTGVTIGQSSKGLRGRTIPEQFY